MIPKVVNGAMMPQGVVVGIDPGVTGGLAVVHGRELIALYDMPTLTDPNGKRRPSPPGVGELLWKHEPHLVVIEMVNAMPSIPGKNGVRRTMGAQSAFNFGRGLGVVETAAQVLGIRTHFVLPKAWKRAAGIKPNSNKDQARTIALQLHPEADLHLKRDIGKADALLIAIFGAT